MGGGFTGLRGEFHHPARRNKVRPPRQSSCPPSCSWQMADGLVLSNYALVARMTAQTIHAGLLLRSKSTVVGHLLVHCDALSHRKATHQRLSRKSPTAAREKFFAPASVAGGSGKQHLGRPSPSQAGPWLSALGPS